MSQHKARRAAINAVKAIYDSLPKLSCQGLCQASCHLTDDLVIGIERERIEERMEEKLELPTRADEKPGDDLKPACGDCPLLHNDSVCSQHELRPLICRLYGLIDDSLMVCPHGCRPARYLSNGDARRLWSKLQEINHRYELQRNSQFEKHGVQA